VPTQSEVAGSIPAANNKRRKLMASQNDITGDMLISKIGNKEVFDRNFDAIFGKKDIPKPPERQAQKWEVVIDNSQHTITGKINGH